MRQEPKPELLSVVFYEANAGWLCYRLTVGKQSFTNRFSHVFDPLPDFKHWLEAIATSVQQASFEYNNEGDYIDFRFEQVSQDEAALTILGADENDDIKALIDRRQIVEAFYRGLLTFASSDKFVAREWEPEPMKVRLGKILKIDEQTLIEHLTEFDKKELREILFNADPIYSISFPEAKDKNEEWRMFLQDALAEDEETSNELKRVSTPIGWEVPDEYDFWTRDKKREFVIKVLNEATMGYDGSKIDDFRSAIIEKYLSEE